MTGLALNIFLAALWLGITGRLNLTNFVMGLTLGALMLLVSRASWTGARYFQRATSAATLIGWCVLELFGAAFSELAACLHRKSRLLRTEIPIAMQSEREIALLSLLVSLSPRILVTNSAPDRMVLVARMPAHRKTVVETNMIRQLQRHVARVLR